jgi:polysaccharide biosynthesis/export protein
MLVLLASIAATGQNTKAKSSKADNTRKHTKAAADDKQASGTITPLNIDPDYVIGIEDVLSIDVWHEPEMSKTVPVRPDGKISLPLVGEFEAAGKTPKKLQDAIEAEMGKLVNKPEVTVIVTEIRSQKFNIIGEVEHPGSFTLTKPMTVLDAIALAGGFREFAKPKKMYILRRLNNGDVQRVTFDYKAMMKGIPNRDVELQARDTVVVP